MQVLHGSCGLIDKVIAGGTVEYRAQVATLAAQLAHSPGYPARLAAKARQFAEAEKHPAAGRLPRCRTSHHEP